MLFNCGLNFGGGSCGGGGHVIHKPKATQSSLHHLMITNVFLPYHTTKSHHITPHLWPQNLPGIWNNQIHFTYCRCLTNALFPVKPLADNQTLPTALGWVLSILSLVCIPTWTSSFCLCVVLCMGGALNYCSWLLSFLPLLSCSVDFFIDFLAS